jgi:hypothetical protein
LRAAFGNPKKHFRQNVVERGDEVEFITELFMILFAETDEQRVAHLPDIVDQGATGAATSVELGDGQPSGDVSDDQRIKTTDEDGTTAGRRPSR